MLHLVLYGLLAVILAGGLFLVASRFLPAGEQIAPPLRDEPPWDLPPDRTLHPDEVDSVRLPVALRGYRFAETDILLDRLAGELRARDEEIARLRGHAPDAPAQDRVDAGPVDFSKVPAPGDAAKPAPASPTPWAPPATSGAHPTPTAAPAWAPQTERSEDSNPEQTGGDDRG